MEPKADPGVARTLLHVDASIRGAGSVSRGLSARFRAAWEAAHPGGRVIYRDLAASPPPHQTEAGWSAGLVPPDLRTAEQTAAWTVSEELIAELEAADDCLFAVPMYNLSVPSSFKAWIDHVVVVGRTLSLAGPPALGGRLTTVITARGGAYGEGTPREGMDFQEPYLRSLFNLLGMTDLEFVHAELTLAEVDPGLAHLKDIADASRSGAEHAIDRRATAMGGLA